MNFIGKSFSFEILIVVNIFDHSFGKDLVLTWLALISYSIFFDAEGVAKILGGNISGSKFFQLKIFPLNFNFGWFSMCF